MSYYLYVINKHRHVFSSDLMKLLIDSLVFSHLNYSLPVWGPSLHQNHLQRLKRMQNRAVHLCRNLNKFDHVTDHYRALRWLPLEYLIQYRCLCTMNRQYHGHRCIHDSLMSTTKIWTISSVWHQSWINICMYVIVITQARVLCLIYTHDARGRVRIYQAKHECLCYN